MRSLPNLLAQVRALLSRHRRQEARGLAHAWMDDSACGPMGRLAAAVVAVAEGFSELAAALFVRVPEDLALMHAPVERVACLAFDGTSAAMAICASASDAMMSDLACADAEDLLALARAALELGVPGISLRLCSVLLGEQRYQDQAIAARDLRVMALACERRLCASYPPVASSVMRVAVVDWAEPGAPAHKRDVDLLALVSGLACGLTLRYRGVNELVLGLVALAPSRTSTNNLPSVDFDVLDPLVDPGKPWLDATWVLVPSVRLDAHFARAAALLSRSGRLSRLGHRAGSARVWRSCVLCRRRCCGDVARVVAGIFFRRSKQPQLRPFPDRLRAAALCACTAR
jgi:hypothetical protein